MIDLSDVTFILRLKCDSADRIFNLTAVLTWLQATFKTSVILVEQGPVPDHIAALTNVQHVKCSEDSSLVHMCAMSNEGLRHVRTPYTCVLDTDVLVYPQFMQQAIDKLRTDECDVCYPYNGKFLDVPKAVFQNSTDVAQAAMTGPWRTYGVCSPKSVGGLFLINTEKYRASGGDNQNMIGWGYDDVERVARWTKLDYRIARIQDEAAVLFHLEHYRGLNSGYNHVEIGRNQGEYEKILLYPPDLLKKYIRTWTWLTNLQSV